jgi:AAA domain
MSSHVPPETPFFTGPVRWLTAAEELDGFAIVKWPELLDGWVAEARGVGMKRKTLASSAQGWLDWLDQVDRLAVVDVEIDAVEDIADLLGFVVEPATRRDIELVIVADQEVEDLDDARFVEPEFGYAYSLERLRWRLRGIKLPRENPAELPDTGFTPDPTQMAAVGAGDGVVQIIAPAGSGKTTVLVERVRELRRRGVPAKSIVCVTFNRAAAKEMVERLAASGVGTVEACTFHSLGLRILREAGALGRDVEIRPLTLPQVRRLAAIASRSEDGVWIEPGEAAEKLSDIKLGLLMTATEYEAHAAASEDPQMKTMAALYKAYEEGQRWEGKYQVDFDDLILKAVRLLREDEEVRGIWQSRFEYLLVDEYQDIEPAQELIVRIVAAPHDQLFCVGDEDQTLYAFRRASVERIIGLDGLYPGLERVSLGVNYRCPGKVVEASRRLIDLNRVRFPKVIDPAPGREGDGEIALHAFERQAEDTGETAKLLKAEGAARSPSSPAPPTPCDRWRSPAPTSAPRSTATPSSSNREGRASPSSGTSSSPSVRRRRRRSWSRRSAAPRAATLTRTPAGASPSCCAKGGPSKRRSKASGRRAATARCSPPGRCLPWSPTARRRRKRSSCCAGKAGSTPGSRSPTTSAGSTSSSAKSSIAPRPTPPNGRRGSTSPTLSSRPRSWPRSATKTRGSSSSPSTAPRVASGRR